MRLERSMMYSRNILYYIIIILLINILTIIPANANNLLIENVSLEDRDPANKTVIIEFDVSWHNTWKTKINHDAVWITVRLHDTSAAPTVKKLCDVNASGVNPIGFSTGSNSDLELDIPTDKKGAFLRQADFGTHATLASSDVRLTIDFDSCGLSATDDVVATVFGLEMVYIPEGSFYAGDFNGSSASLNEGSSDTDPWYITSESTINVSNPASNGYRYVLEPCLL